MEHGDRLNKLEITCSKRGAEMDNLDREIKELKKEVLQLSDKVWSAIDKLQDNLYRLQDSLSKAMIKLGYIIGGAIVIGTIIPWIIMILTMYSD